MTDSHGDQKCGLRGVPVPPKGDSRAPRHEQTELLLATEGVRGAAVSTG